MAIRFQVDPDFYDHPKAIGMSDSATALWVRAGSYSAAKTLDGFVPEHVLSLLSRSPDEAASELVARGLWRRVKGGFRFHQWEHRNLTRARVEADREYDRTRKQRTRQAARQNGNPQVEPENVRTGHRTGLQPESDRSPHRSVSVSVSESVSGSGQRERASPAAGPEPAKEPPPERCNQHRDTPAAGPCGPCGDQRRIRQDWEQEQAATAAAEQSSRARERAAVRMAAIADCRLCDTGGYLPSGVVCSHDPDRVTTASRGAAAARAALAAATKETTE